MTEIQSIEEARERKFKAAYRELKNTVDLLAAGVCLNCLEEQLERSLKEVRALNKIMRHVIRVN